MTYNEYTKELKRITGQVSIGLKCIGISSSGLMTATNRNEGVVPTKFIYMLKGLEAENDVLYQQCKKYRNNEVLQALLKQLDLHS